MGAAQNLELSRAHDHGIYFCIHVSVYLSLLPLDARGPRLELGVLNSQPGRKSGASCQGSCLYHLCGAPGSLLIILLLEPCPGCQGVTAGMISGR